MFFIENAKNNHLLHEAREFLPARRALLVVSGIIAILSLTPTLFMLQLYERVISSRNFYTLVALFCIAVFLVVLWSILEDIRSSILRRVGLALDEKISVRVLDTLNRHPDTLSPQQSPLIYQDLSNVREFFSSPLFSSILDLIYVPLILLVAFLMHVWLGVTLVVLTFISVALTLYSQRVTKEDIGRATLESNRAVEFGRTISANAESVRVMGMLGRLIARWRSMSLGGLGWAQQAQDSAHPYTLTMRTLRHLYPMLMQTVAVLLVLSQSANPGLVFACGLLTYRIIGPVDAVANGWRTIWNMGLSVERINTVLKKAATKIARVELPRPNGTLIVNRVTVIPPGRDAPTLQDVSFVASPGTAVGVVGPSGAGKSTLARALTGAWPLARGAVILDGHDISHWDQENLGQYIGYVPQDIDLLTGTLAENIARFQTVSAENGSMLIEAIRVSAIMDIISRLPDGLSTSMGQGGRVLSGGQRQRIALARAIYGDPRLVVLDEPNSNIDAAGEAQLGAAIEALKEKGAIVVLITHRMNMLSYCDKVLVLNGGAVHAFGERDSVLDRISANQPAQITDRRAVRA